MCERNHKLNSVAIINVAIINLLSPSVCLYKDSVHNKEGREENYGSETVTAPTLWGQSPWKSTWGLCRCSAARGGLCKVTKYHNVKQCLCVRAAQGHKWLYGSKQPLPAVDLQESRGHQEFGQVCAASRCFPIGTSHMQACVTRWTTDLTFFLENLGEE